MFVLLMPLHLRNPEAIPPGKAIVAASMVGVAVIVFILITVARFGLHRLRIATMTPMIVLLLYIFGIGPAFGLPGLQFTKRNIVLMDDTYSARPLTQILNKVSPPPGIVAVWQVRRDVQYGLSFYRNERAVNYDIGIAVSNPPARDRGPHGVVIDDVKEGSSAEEMGLRSLIGDDVVAVNGQPVLNAADFDLMRAGWKPGVRLEFEVLDPRMPAKNPRFVGGIMQDGIPDKQHWLVVPESATRDLFQKLKGRRYEPRFNWPWQNLVIYEVMAREPQTTAVRGR
jgi:hypothetical protein